MVQLGSTSDFESEDYWFESNSENVETRQERREVRRTKERDKMIHHGKSIARIYKNVVSKNEKIQRIDIS